MCGATTENGKTLLPRNTELSRYFRLFLMLACSLTCRGQLITSIAGGGTNYSGANGIPGTAAVIETPQGVATDSAGNVYYFDVGNYVVRQVNASGVVNTVAGNGMLGYSLLGGIGDGGPATQAGFGPMGIFAGLAVDAAGNLYISDPGNNRVRKVDTKGIITTFAGGTPIPGGDGGPATKAGLGQPAGLAVDSAGNVYIADFEFGAVRKVNPQGIISTYAGGGSGGDGVQATAAAVLGPYGLAFDNQGNLYIAQALRVRKVNSQGIISTVAGGTNEGYSGNGGLATSAVFFEIVGIAVDNAGNLYIADNGNYQVRVVNSQGIVNAAAGNGKLGNTGDGGLAADAELIPTGVAVSPSGNLFIADTSNPRIREVNFGKKPAGITTSAASLYFAASLKQLQPVAQYVTAESVNGPVINFTTSVTTQTGGGWLTVDPGNATPQTMAVSIGAGPTTAGTYQGTITITPTTPGYPPVNVQVTYAISATAPAAPVITDVENGASFQSEYLGGSIWTIKGTNLASITGSDNWNNSIVNGQLPTSLDGVTVTFAQVPGYISYLSPTQINVMTPSGGYGDVVVNNNGAVSADFNAYPPGLSAPAFFVWPNNQVVATRTDYSYAVAPGTFSGLTTVADKPGDVLVLWGTGFGATTPAVQDGAVVPADQEYATSTMPTVTINGVSATVYGAALAAGFAGLYQVAIQVPAGLGAGTWPIVATMGAIYGVQSPGNVMLVVNP